MRHAKATIEATRELGWFQILSDELSRSGFLTVLRIREFRLLWIADAQSLLGDQLARVALAVLVYARTGSGLATSGVYALTFLPALFGSILLGHLADRLPRRVLLVGGDVIRAVLLGCMAIPGMPLLLLVGMLVVAVVVGTPWKAAESALVVDLVDSDQYALGTGVRTATVQAAQLLGFGAGGLIVAVIGSRSALAVDAVSFAVSADIIRVGIRARPAAAADGRRAPGRWWDGARSVFAQRELRLLLGLAWLVGLLIVPEGLAAPYAASAHGGPTAVGVLLAAGPAGVLVGSLIFTRFVSDTTRAALLGPLAVAAGLPLVACVLGPNLLVTWVLWALSGLCLAYQVQVVTEFVRVVPAEIRGQGIAVASSGILAVQGLGLLAGGLLTELASPGTAIALAGGAATVLAALAGGRRRTLRRSVTALAGLAQ